MKAVKNQQSQQPASTEESRKVETSAFGLTLDDIKTLKAPFPTDRLGVKVQTYSKDRTRAMLVLYLQHTDVQNRIEEVDPSWTTEVLYEHLLENTYYVRIRMGVKGVLRENVGEGGDPKAQPGDVCAEGKNGRATTGASAQPRPIRPAEGGTEAGGDRRAEPDARRCAGQPARARAVARGEGQSAHGPRDGEPLLAGYFRHRAGAVLAGFRHHGRPAVAPRAARLAGRGFSRSRLGREAAHSRAGDERDLPAKRRGDA